MRALVLQTTPRPIRHGRPKTQEMLNLYREREDIRAAGGSTTSEVQRVFRMVAEKDESLEGTTEGSGGRWNYGLQEQERKISMPQ